MYAELQMELETKEINYRQSSNLQGVIMENISPEYAARLHGNQLNPYSPVSYTHLDVYKRQVYGYLEALKQYQKQKYDLFLLDINLPDGNGLEFCEKIRETSETPVLFLTANDTEEDMLEGFGVGCDDYISKPFSIEVLRKKVLAVLKRSGVGKFRMKYRDLELDKEKCLVLMKGQEIHLTSTEYKLLLYLMENRGRVVTVSYTHLDVYKRQKLSSLLPEM